MCQKVRFLTNLRFPKIGLEIKLINRPVILCTLIQCCCQNWEKSFCFWCVRLLNIFLKKTMAPFYGWGSAVSRLQSHYEETVYFLLIIPSEILVPIYLTSICLHPFLHYSLTTRSMLHNIFPKGLNIDRSCWYCFSFAKT